MSMIRKLLLIGICMMIGPVLSCHAFAASSSGAIEVSKLDMVIKNIAMKTGQSRTIYVNISPGKADDRSVIWTSSDSGVATVQAAAGNGKATVTAVGEGKAKITATSQNGKTAVCSITVSDDEVEVRRIEMTASSATIRINQKKTLSVQVYPQNADDKTVIWDSGNPKVAMVEDDGIVTGISAGTAEITATSANGKTDVITVTVLAETLTETGRQAEIKDLLPNDSETSISGSVSMPIGNRKDLSELIKYKESYKDGDGEWHTVWQLRGTVSWASSFPEVVSVNDKGVATAHRTGTARITATGRDETGQKRVQTIVVGVSSGISADSSNSFEASEGSWLDLSQAAALPSGAKDIKWTSSAPDIASVDSGGLVLAESIGLCTATASYVDENKAEQTVNYKLRVTAGMLSNKTKNSTIVLKVGDKIDAGKIYYPKLQNSPGLLNQYSCTTNAQKVLSADDLSVFAKSAGTASVLIRHTDGTICHKLTIVVKK